MEVMSTKFLQTLKNRDYRVHIYLINGIKLGGVVDDFDKRAIILTSGSNPEQLVYIHSIASIMVA